MAGDTPYGAIRDGAVGIVGERIAWVGAERDLPRDASAHRSLDARGRVGDAGPHRLPHASRLRRQSRRRVRSAPQRRHVRRNRAGRRRHQGHGRATRAATEDELVAASRPRLAALADEGVTTVEIKSGYGLDTANECRQLRAARRVAAEIGVDVRTTLLAAHAVPPEFDGRADDYVDLVCGEIIPAAARGARGCRRCVLRDDRLHARRRRDAFSRPRARTGCR